MAKRVCLDAGVVVRFYVPEEGQDRARALLERIRDEVGGQIVAPAFMAAEVLSICRRKVAQGKISAEDGDGYATRFLRLLAGIRQLAAPELYGRAWEMATQLGLPTVYDAVYLAVAEAEGAEFWTADQKLYERALGAGWSWVKLI